jgi:hypothetical protein
MYVDALDVHKILVSLGECDSREMEVGQEY